MFGGCGKDSGKFCLGNSARGSLGLGIKLFLLLLLSLLLLSSLPQLKNSSLSWSFLSLSQISRSLMSGAFSRNLLKSFFFQCLTFLIKEPIIEFWASKYFTSLDNISIGFWFFIIFFENGSSFCLKLVSMYCLWHKDLFHPVFHYQIHMFLRNTFLHFCWAYFLQFPVENLSWEKSILSSQSM